MLFRSRTGQPAVTGDGVLVGKVAAVTPLSATVMLLTDPRSRLAVALLDAEGTIGLLEGDRGTSLRIGLIPQESAVSPDDLVITSGLETGIRRGLVVGTVDQVSSGAQDPFQTALVRQSAAAARPLYLTVLLGEGAAACLIFDDTVLDGRIVVDSATSFATTKELTHRTGIFAGISAGSAVRAAQRTAERMQSGQVVCLLADGGWKYLSTGLWSRDYADIEERVAEKMWW